MTVDGEGFGEEVGWVEEGADVWEDKHLLGDGIPEPIPAKIHRFGLLALDSIMDHGQALWYTHCHNRWG